MADMADVDGEEIPHELEEFLRQDQTEIAAEYKRIYRRSTEDPGTAGDEGEENWAGVLRKWLPETYQVLTKGRIVFPDKTATPQIDVLVLRPGYPPRLVDKKLYLSSGVVAAFECKNTLKARHVADAAATALFVKSKIARRLGALQSELQPPLVYGLLSHSHSWKGESSTPIANVDAAVTATFEHVTHPSDLIDIICVADLAVWTLYHFVECPWFHEGIVRRRRLASGVRPEGQVRSMFTRFTEGAFGPEVKAPNPIAVFVAQLLRWLGWEDENLRHIADYFRFAGLFGSGDGPGLVFGLDVFSEDVQERLKLDPPTQGLQRHWDPWRMWV